MAERSSNALAMTMIAGLAGATIGVLTAPRSGKETRSMIKHKAEEAKAKAKTRFASGQEKVKELKDSWSETAKDTGRRAKHEFDSIRSEDTTASPLIKTWEDR